MLFCLSRKRRGHSRAHDDVNEEFIGLFKPILGRGKPTHARMEKISKNLVLLRDNKAELRAASGIRQKKDNDEKGSPADEVEICIAYFKEIKVLDNTARKVDSVFKLSERKMPEKERKKIMNLYGRIESRSLEHTLSKFLPKALSDLQKGVPSKKDDDDDEDDDLLEHIDLDNEEWQAREGDDDREIRPDFF